MTLPDYESILSRGREESVQQIEDIFSNPDKNGFYLPLGFQSRQEHANAIHPNVTEISINHNLGNIMYALTGIYCSPEDPDREGEDNIILTALAQEILVCIYTSDQKRRIAKVLKTTVREFCEVYRDNSQDMADRIRENPKPNSDGPEHAEYLVQLQQNKIDFIDYIVRRLEE